MGGGGGSESDSRGGGLYKWVSLCVLSFRHRPFVEVSRQTGLGWAAAAARRERETCV